MNGFPTCNVAKIIAGKQKNLRPLHVVWQECGIDQVRVSEEDVAACAKLQTVSMRSVAIERGSEERRACKVGEAVEVVKLILCECLGWEDENCGRSPPGMSRGREAVASR